MQHSNIINIWEIFLQRKRDSVGFSVIYSRQLKDFAFKCYIHIGNQSFNSSIPVYGARKFDDFFLSGFADRVAIKFSNVVIV